MNVVYVDDTIQLFYFQTNNYTRIKMSIALLLAAVCAVVTADKYKAIVIFAKVAFSVYNILEFDYFII